MPGTARRYRAIFVSDLHLGTRGCQSRLFLEFLRDVDADTIYLVGDIVDGWRLKAAWYWPQEHNDVVQKLLRKVRKGVRIIYLPGNHDEFLRDYYGTHFGGVEVVESAIHKSADGRRFLVVHGDAFDIVVRHARWLALMGDWAYELALWANGYVNRLRRGLGLTYWSLSQWAKLKVKNAVNFIGEFESALVTEAKRHGVDGIICGHIHHAAMHDRLGLTYINCGDWVESCTAIAETYDGVFEIIRWPAVAGAASPGSDTVASGGGRLMRILVATDAWQPQINGVVRSLEQTAAALSVRGVAIEFLAPDRFPTVPLPTYPDIRLALIGPSEVRTILRRGGFDAVHIATEGPVGLAARRACIGEGLAFTTSYHTRFPEYLRVRAPIPEGWSYAWLRRFHNSAAGTMVSTPTLRDELCDRGFERLTIWSRGVDTDLFRPRADKVLPLPGPIFLYVGRLAVEKNLDGFLNLALPGTKVVVGDGPERGALQARHPDAVFLGSKTGEDLAAIYASADVFVFPSRTDTYGIVLLEALASGLPVAAFPATAPRDVLGRQEVGVMDENLQAAALAALSIPGTSCRAFALERTWAKSAGEFLANIVPVNGARCLSA